nr:MAG: capsid precursor protein [Bat astrovirus]
MADAAPKPRRMRRRRRFQGNNGAAPTADATPSGSNPRGRRRRTRRRARVPAAPGAILENPVVSTRRFIHRAIKREIKREGLEGPKVAVQQRITSTFGLVGPNTTDSAELELNFFCHPSLAKEANDGTAFGPLQALAAQYALWKIKYLSLRFTPMVGSSAVSGTVVRASLNLSQSPGGSNWSGLGTRVHLDMHPGQSATFHLRGDQVGGPRDGGWWFTDTNEEGSQSAGPIVEIHTLGKTMSTFQDKAWTGPLFLVEGIGVWQFANYQVKPALGQLERREATVLTDINAEAGQPITMDLPNDSDVALFMDSVEPEAIDLTRSGPMSVGETIFQIVDVGAQIAESAAPPPFQWLIKGGWWFVKKLLGRTRAGKSTYVVYASLADAQNNKPAIATGTIDTNSKTTSLLVTQINAPNVGPAPAGAALARAGPQTLYPGMSFRVHAEMISECIVSLTKTGQSNSVQVPVSLIPGMARASNGTPSTQGGSTSYIQTPWWIGIPGRAPDASGVLVPPNSNTGGYIHSLYRLINPRFTDQSGNVEYFQPPAMSGLNFCAMNKFNVTGIPSAGNPYAVYGKVVATNLIQGGGAPPLSMVVTLIKTTQTYNLDADKVSTLVGVYGDNVGQARFTTIPPLAAQTSWNILERGMPVGSYLLGISYTNDPAQVLGAYVPTTIQLLTYDRTESTTSAIFPYNLSGQMFASTSVDTTLTYVDEPSFNMDVFEQLSTLQPRPLVNMADPNPSWWPHDPEVTEDDDDDSDESEAEQDLFWRILGDNMVKPPKEWEHLWDENGDLKPQYKLE